MITSVLRAVAIFFGVQLLVNTFVGKRGQQQTQATDAEGNPVQTPGNRGVIPPYHARPKVLDQGAVYNPIPQRLAPIWPLDSALDVVIVISSTPRQEPLAELPEERIVLREKTFKLGNYSDTRTVSTEFAVPEAVQNNGTLWGHFYIGLTGSVLDPSVAGFDPETGTQAPRYQIDMADDG